MDIYRYYYTKAAGVSYYNPSYYSNPIVDHYIDQAMQAAAVQLRKHRAGLRRVIVGKADVERLALPDNLLQRLGGFGNGRIGVGPVVVEQVYVVKPHALQALV